MPSLLPSYLRVRRFLLIHRRGISACCLALAVWLSLSVLRPAPPATVQVWTATHDLDGGSVLAAADFRRTEFLPGSAPAAAVDDPATLVGRTLASPLSRGEVLTRTQVVGAERLAGYPGRAAVGLRIPDADAGSLLRPGDHVDLVASDPQAHRPAELLVHDAVVLAAAGAPTRAGSPTSTGVLVVFAVPADEVVHVADVGTSLFLTPIWNR